MNLTRPSRFAGESKPHVRSFRLIDMGNDKKFYINEISDMHDFGIDATWDLDFKIKGDE